MFILEDGQGSDSEHYRHGGCDGVPPSAGTFEATYFNEVYDGRYDCRNPRYKHRSYCAEVRRAIRLERAGCTGVTLLDIGCAYGSFLREAAAHFQVAGCDISHHAVSVAANRVQAARVFQSDIAGIPSDERYDVITCFDVLEHVPEVDKALSKILQLLTPDGLLVATVPVYDTVVGRLVGLLDKDPTHFHKTSRYRWVKRIAAAGFEEVRWKGIVRYYFGGPVYLHFTTKLLRRVAPAVLVVGYRARGG